MRLLFAGYSKQAVLNFFKQVLKLAKILNYIATKGGGRPTRLLLHVKMLLIPIQSFLPVSIAPYKLSFLRYLHMTTQHCPIILVNLP